MPAVTWDQRAADLGVTGLGQERIVLSVEPIPDLNPWGYQNNTHLLPLELVGPTGVDGWKVRLPGGREIGLLSHEHEALVAYPTENTNEGQTDG